jgi:short-subunit dehydrogenase
MNMERRSALVTGASAGLGVEFARQLAVRGFDLLLIARRSKRLRSLAKVLTENNHVRVETLPVDLSVPESPSRILAYAHERGLQIDFLVNNAGSAGKDLLQERSWSEHAEYLELMMISVAQMCHLFVPPMCGRGHGRVINVASVAGRIPRSNDLTYGPSKAYLVALSEALDLTVRSSGVRVSALCPGYTHTEFHRAGGLLEMKARTPAFIWYDAEVVVREGLRAVEKGKSVIVSGRLYRWLDPLLQWIWSRRLIKRFMYRGFGSAIRNIQDRLC